MSTPTLQQRSQTLFQNYNNINFDTAREFVDYVFSLPTGGPFLPLSAGVAFPLTGDLVIDTVIKDSTGGHIRSADFNNRFLADASGVARLNWANGTWFDSLAHKSLNIETRQVFNSAQKLSIDYQAKGLYMNDGTTVSFDWQLGIVYDTASVISIDAQNRIQKDSFNKLSVDWENRRLYKSDGTTVAFNWETGSISFVDLSLTGDLKVAGTIDDGADLASINVNTRELIGSSGATTIDYQNRFLYTGWIARGSTNDNTSYSFRTQTLAGVDLIYCRNDKRIGFFTTAPESQFNFSGTDPDANIFQLNNLGASDGQGKCVIASMALGFGISGWAQGFVMENQNSGNFVISSYTKDTVFQTGNRIEAVRIKSTGVVNNSLTPVYADNAAALLGGLVAGDQYRTATGARMEVF